MIGMYNFNDIMYTYVKCTIYNGNFHTLPLSSLKMEKIHLKIHATFGIPKQSMILLKVYARRTCC